MLLPSQLAVVIVAKPARKGKINSHFEIDNSVTCWDEVAGCHHQTYQTTLIKLSYSLSAKEGLPPLLIWNINIIIDCSMLR